MEPTIRRLFAICLAMTVAVGVGTVFFNGVLNATQSVVVDASRDWATVVQIIEMITLALVARRFPRAIDMVSISVVAILATCVGTSLSGWGVVAGNPALLVFGTCLTASASAWMTLLLLVLCSALPFRWLFVCLAMGNMLAIPLATLLSAGGYWFALVLSAVLSIAAICVCTRLTRASFEGFARAESAVDAQITRPAAIMPLTHDLFIYIFAFYAAYGFGLRFEHADGGIVANGLSVVILAILTVYAVAQHGEPRADTLFEVAFSLIVCGLLAVLLDDGRIAQLASILLVCASTVFGVLMFLALCAIAARNRSNVLSALGWGLGAYFMGIEVGAQLGIFFTALPPEAHLEAKAAVALVTAALMLYTLRSIRDFGFDKAIAEVAPEPEPVVIVEVQYTDKVDARCAELVDRLGLTDREADVFRLLVRGNNTLRIQDALCISKNTLKYHVRHIYEKSGVHSQQELIDLL